MGIVTLTAFIISVYMNVRQYARMGSPHKVYTYYRLTVCIIVCERIHLA